MGLFGGIEGAKFTDGGVYLQPGLHQLKIRAVKMIHTRANKDAFVAEFNVISSTNAAHKPGSEVSWMVTMDKDSALGNIKQFLASVLDQPMEAITEAVATACLAVEQNGQIVQNHLGGREVYASAFNIKTKAKTDFTKVKFCNPSKAAEMAAEHQKNAAANPGTG